MMIFGCNALALQPFLLLMIDLLCLFLNMVDTSKRKDGKEKREAPIPIGSQ